MFCEDGLPVVLGESRLVVASVIENVALSGGLKSADPGELVVDKVTSGKFTPGVVVEAGGNVFVGSVVVLGVAVVVVVARDVLIGRVSFGNVNVVVVEAGVNVFANSVVVVDFVASVVIVFVAAGSIMTNWSFAKLILVSPFAYLTITSDSVIRQTPLFKPTARVITARVPGSDAAPLSAIMLPKPVIVPAVLSIVPV